MRRSCRRCFDAAGADLDPLGGSRVDHRGVDHVTHVEWVSGMSHTGGVEFIPDEAMAAIVASLEPSSTVVGTSGLPGGLSSWMTTVEVERPDGSRHRFVIRRGRRPDAERDTLPFGVEFELLHHLAAHGIPVATPRMFDDSGRILPQAFVVLDFVRGATRFTTDDPVGMAWRMADVLAAIHDLDATEASMPVLPLQTDRMQGWVITDLTRREPDASLREDLVRRHLDEHWPPAATERCLLHADYFPGNIVWDGDVIAAVIDWEAAALGDPMSDLATTRLDLRWAFGAEIAEQFTDRYLSVTGRSTDTLAVWELVVALRPAGAVSLWAGDMAAHGRPDITSDIMRREQHAYVDSALQRLSASTSES
jgi:aminoglycoside phosphotransferase (APT) family kinase protein